MFHNLSLVRHKSFAAVTDFLFLNGKQTKSSIVSSTGLSYVTVTKVLEYLLDFNMAREYDLNGKTEYSLYDELPVAVIDLSDDSYSAYTYLLDSSFKENRLTSPDYRFFNNERLSIFLHDCATLLSRDKNSRPSVHIILPSRELYRSKQFTDVKKNILRLCQSYFKSFNVSYHTESDCIGAFANTTHKNKSIMCITAKNNRIYAAVSSARNKVKLNLIRNTETELLAAETDSKKTAAAIASALGNTILLLGTETVYFDNIPLFRDNDFTVTFERALKVFLGEDHPKRLEIVVHSKSLVGIGTVHIAYQEYCKRLQLLENEMRV